MHQKRAPGIMYDELVLTTKTYARGVSGIELAWLRTKVGLLLPRLNLGDVIVLTRFGWQAPTVFDAVPKSKKVVAMEE